MVGQWSRLWKGAYPNDLPEMGCKKPSQKWRFHSCTLAHFNGLNPACSLEKLASFPGRSRSGRALRATADLWCSEVDAGTAAIFEANYT